ncbi:hypothetical protein D3C76_1208530 [compost metagenome]
MGVNVNHFSVPPVRQQNLLADHAAQQIFEKQRNHIRIQLPENAQAHLADQLMKRQRGMVRPVGGHGVEHIGHSNDPAQLVDLGSLQLQGIAAAVLALMMLQGHKCHPGV